MGDTERIANILEGHGETLRAILEELQKARGRVGVDVAKVEELGLGGGSVLSVAYEDGD